MVLVLVVLVLGVEGAGREGCRCMQWIGESQVCG